jgi:hypothetical protein
MKYNVLADTHTPSFISPKSQSYNKKEEPLKVNNKQKSSKIIKT